MPATPTTRPSRALAAASAFVGALLLAAFALPAASMAASTPMRGAWVTNAPVETTVTDAQGRTYIGGAFDKVGPRLGSAIALTTTNDQPSAGFPDVVGTVDVIEPDGSGGWYIAGAFSSVGGVAKSNLAHIRADRTVDKEWNPQPNSLVNGITRFGTDLYVTGWFTTIGGEARAGFAKLSTAGVGAADPNWGTAVPLGRPIVNALQVVGGKLYVGGRFKFESGEMPFEHVARLSLTGDGTPDPTWSPYVIGYEVKDLAFIGGSVFLAGDFGGVGLGLDPQPRSGLAKVSMAAGALPDATWDPDPNGRVDSLEAVGDALAVGGDFSTIGGQSRRGLALLATTGAGAADATWNPNLEGYYIDDLRLAGGTLYVAGDFYAVGDKPIENLARVSASGSGAVDASWKPSPAGRTMAVALAGSDVVAGGQFATAGSTVMSGSSLVRIDADGRPDASWTPGVEGEVKALAVVGDQLYLGGVVMRVGRWGVTGVARVSTAGTGLVDKTFITPNLWNVLPITSIAASADAVFLGFNGLVSPEGGTMKLSPVNGSQVTAWDPETYGKVNALALSANGGTLYVGGDLEESGGETVGDVIKVSATGTGLTDRTWVPASNGIVQALLLDGTSLFVGGKFSEVSGSPRNNAAQISTSGTGEALPTFRPALDDAVWAITKNGDDLYVGGKFTKVGLKPRGRLAKFSASTGVLAEDFVPSAFDTTVLALSAPAGRLIVGGQFYGAGEFAANNLAVFDLRGPSAVLTVPADGARYVQGSNVAAEYACTDLDGPANVTSCVGTVGNGAAIDTSTPGPKTFTVTTTDAGGNVGTPKTVTYVVDPAPVVPGPPAPPTSPAPPATTQETTSPILSGLLLKPSKFKAAKSGAPTTPVQGKKPKKGTRVTFTLSEAGTVTLTVILPKKGKKKAKTIGTFTVPGVAGVNSFDVLGRVPSKSKTKAIARGNYTLTLIATDAAGNVSAPQTKKIQITG